MRTLNIYSPANSQIHYKAVSLESSCTINRYYFLTLKFKVCTFSPFSHHRSGYFNLISFSELVFSSFFCFRFHILGNIYIYICHSMSHSFHLAYCLQSPAPLPHVAGFPFLWQTPVPFYR